jgi:hypothetical protein
MFSERTQRWVLFIISKRAWCLGKDKLKIIDCNGYYTIVNLNGSYENHTHIKRQQTCKMLIKLFNKRAVPKSEYLRESCKRLILDKSYIEKIEIKQEKDKNKQSYLNSQKGVRRWSVGRIRAKAVYGVETQASRYSVFGLNVSENLENPSNRWYNEGKNWRGELYE